MFEPFDLYHPYPINLDINRRIHVFIHQLMPDIYKNTNTFAGKIINLKFIFNKMEYLLDKDETIIITNSDNIKFIQTLRNIVFKSVSGQSSKHILRMIEEDTLPYMKWEL